jgi:hypothetical protein
MLAILCNLVQLCAIRKHVQLRLGIAEEHSGCPPHAYAYYATNRSIARANTGFLFCFDWRHLAEANV